jgi:hypothetical protein
MIRFLLGRWTWLRARYYLLNAIARSHGRLMWGLEQSAPEDFKRTGLAHTLSFGVLEGIGSAVYIR